MRDESNDKAEWMTMSYAIGYCVRMAIEFNSIQIGPINRP